VIKIIAREMREKAGKRNDLRFASFALFAGQPVRAYTHFDKNENPIVTSTALVLIHSSAA
jgi:hypothetical protein